MRIERSSPADGIQRNLGRTHQQLGQSHSKLASGERISTAADDASGLVISERLRSVIASLDASSRNVNDGLNLAGTAERGLDEVGDLLGRMRELAVYASNGTLSRDDRANLTEEFTTLRNEVDRISSSLEFNGVKLLDGSTEGVTVQAGPQASDMVDVVLEGTTPGDLGIEETDLSDAEHASDALDELDAAIDSVSDFQGSLGSTTSALSSRSRSLGHIRESSVASESRVRDTDYAVESARLVQQQIQAEGNLSLLTQANMSSDNAITHLMTGA